MEGSIPEEVIKCGADEAERWAVRRWFEQFKKPCPTMNKMRLLLGVNVWTIEYYQRCYNKGDEWDYDTRTFNKKIHFL